jgi:Uma2 family endonuclease
MSSVTTLPWGQAMTEADLEAMPDDGRRYELVDGALIVTPAPSVPHQLVVGELYLLLRAACPPDLRVMLAPLDVRISATTVLQPDLLAAAKATFAEKNLPAAPLLAIEVLSPSTRHIDLGLKRSLYEAAGCPSYWVVDPDVPSLSVWELESGGYREVGVVVGDERLSLSRPFAVTVAPGALLT